MGRDRPFDVHLLFPPPWSAFHSVHLSLPLLKGHLARAGLRATVTDLNIAVAGRLLRPEVVREAAREIARDLRTSRHALPEAAADAKETALGAAPFAAAELPGALATLRAPGDRLASVAAAAQALRLAAMVISARDWPATWDVVAGSYRSAELAGSYALDEALRALRRRKLDAVEAALREEVLAAVDARPARLYGFGLACSEQMYPALRCAAWIREADPDARFAIGGAAVPFMDRTLPLIPSFFDVIDFVVVDDGEEPLVQLARALESGAPPESVPNLRWREGRRVRRSERTWSAGFEVPACPDFGDVRLDRYLAQPALPYLTGRRCYWNRCTFCSITYDKSTPFGPVPVTAIVDQLGEVAARTGCRTFTFVDEVVPAPRIRRISEAIRERRLDVTWDALLRFEEKYEPLTFERAFEAGCRAVYFGLESGSQRVVDLMEKGFRIPTAERCLDQATAAGIWTHCFVMLGFPGEGESDFRATVDFCRRNAEHIDSVASGHFNADLISPCGENPAQFGLAPHELPPLSLDHRRPQPERMSLMVERVHRFRDETADLHFSYLNMGALNGGNLLARLRARAKEGFREMQAALAREAMERRRAAAAGPAARVRLSPEAALGEPIDGAVPVYERSGATFAILPAEWVRLAAGGATLGALAGAGAAPEALGELIQGGVLVPSIPGEAAAGPASQATSPETS